MLVIIIRTFIASVFSHRSFNSILIIMIIISSLLFVYNKYNF